MAKLQDIFKRYGPDYLNRFGCRVLPSHRRAIFDIIECRTEAFGGHLTQCNYCGAMRYAYHSCRNRSCPQCHGKETKRWLDNRAKELLPVPYYHLVFTLPKELHGMVRSHQKLLYGLLMKTAAHSLMKLALDHRYVGGKIAVLCVLHTWTRAMAYHPHVHCLVPGGGYSLSRHAWLPARDNFFVPVCALTEIFRAKFMEAIRKAFPEETLPKSLWQGKWVVHCKPALQGTPRVVKYLGRYVHRIAITNNRIVSFQEGKVTFRYKDTQKNRWKKMTLPVFDFIQRYLQHVLPRGFHKVRYFGLLSPLYRFLLGTIKKRLCERTAFSESEKSHEEADLGEQKSMLPNMKAMLCPFCRSGHLIAIFTIRPKGRDPPRKEDRIGETAYFHKG